jgi:hypothetical protein
MFGTLRAVIDRVGGLARRSGGRVERLGRRTASDAVGLAQRVRHWNAPPKDLDDVTLARKVETELFRPADAPKGSVNIDVVDGVVTLRGEVKSQTQVQALERSARAIPEVRGVENLLKLPKTPARTRADAPGRSKRAATRQGRGAAPLGSEESSPPRG